MINIELSYTKRKSTSFCRDPLIFWLFINTFFGRNRIKTKMFWAKKHDFFVFFWSIWTVLMEKAGPPILLMIPKDSLCKAASFDVKIYRKNGGLITQLPPTMWMTPHVLYWLYWIFIGFSLTTQSVNQFSEQKFIGWNEKKRDWWRSLKYDYCILSPT